jgi:hypothetical protein
MADRSEAPVAASEMDVKVPTNLFVLGLLAASAVSSGANGGQAAASPRPRPAVPENCALTVAFSSYAMGIDLGMLARVESLLAADRGVTKVERFGWGREGEMTLCATTRSGRDATRLFRAIVSLAPAKPRGPVTVSTRSGLTFSAPRLRRTG